MNTFEARRLARIERLKKAAARKAAESDRYRNRSRSYTEYIPFGQPILVGHHSEGAHRRALDKSWNALGKAIETGKEAADLARRAEAAENSTAIFTDDPEAPAKLREKIATLEEMQKRYKIINSLLRKDDIPGLMAIGLTEAQITAFKTPDWSGRIGIPSYALTNNNANIRRLKERLEALEKSSAQESSEKEINGVIIRENVEENRCQLIFPGIPSPEIRQFLKSRGFRWSRFNSAWQRHRSNPATFYAKEAANMQPAPAQQQTAEAVNA